MAAVERGAAASDLEMREKRGRGEGEEGDKGSLVINKKMVFDK